MELDSAITCRSYQGTKGFHEAFLLTNYLYNELNRHTAIFHRSGHDTSGSCNSFPLSFLFDTYHALTIHYSPGLPP